MTRLTDLPPDQAKRLAELECPNFETRRWVTGPALAQRRIAIVSSAGLVVRGDDQFRGRDPHYHAIPAATRAEDLLSATYRSISSAPASRKTGTSFSRRRLTDWSWNETTTGAALQALRAMLQAHEEKRLRTIVSNFIVPAARVRNG